MACDICGKRGTSLTDLLDGYATAEIKSICPDCARIVNDKVWAIRSVTDGMTKTLIKRFMGERAASVADKSVQLGKGGRV